MKKLLCTIAICILTHPTFAGIELPANCEVGLPSLLRKMMVKESELETLISSGTWGQSTKLQKYWVVYSDRSQNTTYDAPSVNGHEYDKLYFGEQVRIAKIENNFALVYTECKKSAIYPLISSCAKSKGWIPMKNLLLCNSCPTNEAGIYNKALIVLNYDEAKKSVTDIGKCYQNPILKDSAQKLVADMNFFFVMKKADNGMVLLSRECKMDEYTNSDLYGWVSTSSFIPWSHRICIEPNWNPSVAEEFKGKRIYVYRNGNEATDVIELGRVNRITGNPTTKYRLEPQLMRYPLLGDNPTDDNQYSIFAFAKPAGGESFISFKGTVDKCDSITGCNYWQPVILLSSDEFAQLMERLQPVISAATTGNRRPYVEALKEFVRLMIPGITPKEMDEMDVKKVMTLVEALPVKSNVLERRTLLEIYDKNIVGDDEFDGIISDFQNKFRRLKKIRENRYDFSFERNKTTWYWIPLEYLP